jgi:hypothetical protein
VNRSLFDTTTGRIAGGVVAGALAVLLSAAPALAAGLDTVSGYAYGESVDVTLLSAVHVTSGPLPEAGPIPSSGGSDNGSALSVCVPLITCSVLKSDTLTVSTTGTTGPSGSVSSDASVENVSALDNLLDATPGVIAAHCGVDSNGATSGSATLTTVYLNGVLLASNPGPNTSLVLLDANNVAAGHVILNEQIYDAGTNTLTVNAIHIKLDVANNSIGSGDIIISHVKCDSSPAGPAPVIPESPLPILLPLTALVVVGGSLMVARARRTTTTER